jgi:hypothetical protein
LRTLGGCSRRSRAWLVVVLLLGSLSLVSCGGDDGDTEADEQKYSAADEPPRVFAERVAKLIATSTRKQDCAQLEEIASLVTFACPTDKKLRKSMRSFRIVGAEEYGTGAVVDYESGESKDGAAITLFVTPDRKWGIGQFGVLTQPSTKTTDEESRAGFDRAVNEYLAAVRKRDCKAYTDVAYTRNVKKSEVCKVLFATTTDALAKRLKADPAARPEYQGGNGTFGFYGIETKRPVPKNSTISVVRGEEDGKPSYVVLDVTLSPTAAVQRAAQREIRKRRAAGNMEPSSKPSEPAVK